MNIFYVPECAIMHNTKIKEYPNGDLKITVASKAIFKEKGFELITDDEKSSKPKNMDNPSRDDSIKRAKDRVYDIVRMNDFDYFVTLTFNGAKINRSCTDEISDKFKNFLSNLVQRNGIKYLFIAEYHKKNNAIHFHGFIKGNIQLVDSGTVDAKGFDKPIKIETAKRYKIPLEECRTVYNMPQWKWGFSTVKKTYGNRIHAAKYITKYISKDMRKIFGSYYFAGGKDLIRDVPSHLTDTDFITFEADTEIYCPAIETSFKYRDTSKNLEDKTNEI